MLSQPFSPTASARFADTEARPVSPAILDHLQERLRALPFPDFAACCARLLQSCGYHDVRLMGATHERGRNLHGGFDIEASLLTGLSRSRVLVQVKQYAHSVPRAFVDELRGAMLRLGAQEGVILTTHSFAPSAVDAVQAGQHAASVRLIDGNRLAGLLLEHDVTLAPSLKPTPRSRSGSDAAKTPPTMPQAGTDRNGSAPGAVPILDLNLPEPGSAETPRPQVCKDARPAVHLTLVFHNGGNGSGPRPSPVAARP